jgi:thymidylate synthase ThyX
MEPVVYYIAGTAAILPNGTHRRTRLVVSERGRGLTEAFIEFILRGMTKMVQEIVGEKISPAKVTDMS